MFKLILNLTDATLYKGRIYPIKAKNHLSLENNKTYELEFLHSDGSYSLLCLSCAIRINLENIFGFVILTPKISFSSSFTVLCPKSLNGLHWNLSFILDPRPKTLTKKNVQKTLSGSWSWFLKRILIKFYRSFTQITEQITLKLLYILCTQLPKRE